MQTMPRGSPWTLVFWRQRYWYNSIAVNTDRGTKYTHGVGSSATFDKYLENGTSLGRQTSPKGPIIFLEWLILSTSTLVRRLIIMTSSIYLMDYITSETERLLKVTDSHIHCKSGNI